MKKTDETAYPVPAEDGTFPLGCEGFTKHEKGAFMIAQGLVSKYNIKTPEDQQIIAQLSYELSAEILKQFK